MADYDASIRAGDAAELETAVSDFTGGILLLDFSPVEDFPLLIDLRNAMRTCKLVLWVDSISVEAAYQAMKLGVRGIVRKTDSADAIICALDNVASGQVCFDAKLTDRLLESRTVELTPRESDLVPLVAQGLKNKEVAAVLGISEATVRIYLSALFRKLGVRDRYELAIYAMKNMGGPTSAGAKSDVPARLRSMLVDGASEPSGTPHLAVRVRSAGRG